MQNGTHECLTQNGQLARGVERQPAALLELKVNIRRPLVEADADVVQLALEKRALHEGFGGVEHHQHHVGGARDGDDLATTTAAFWGIKCTIVVAFSIKSDAIMSKMNVPSEAPSMIPGRSRSWICAPW